MYKKMASAAPFLLLLIMVLGVVFSTISSVKSEGEPPSVPASVHLSPESPIGIDIGETFTVTVSVSGLAGKNLYGFEVALVWNTAAVRYVSHEVKVPVETYSEGVLYQPIVKVKNDVNSGAGTYWVAVASMLPAGPFNNDGVLFTITFVLMQKVDNPYALGPLILSDNEGREILTSGFQYIGNQTPGSGSHKINEAAIRKWLEWWITVVWHIPKAVRQ
jgi:hypothetical protein